MYMQGFLDAISNANGWLNNIVWGAPMMILIVGTGILLTVLTKFLQFRRFGYIMRNTIGTIFRKQTVSDKGAVSPFQAVCTALAATVGTGNIAGVAGAIALGGPGAVFWMWISALFGMATKYAEVVLAIRFRERNQRDEWVGGPMYYIKNGLGKRWKWLAVLFSVFGALAAFGIGNMTQVNTIAGSVVTSINAFTTLDKTGTTIINLVVGVVIAAIAALVLLGGLKRIGRVTEKLVPFMSVIYIIGALTVVFSNIGQIGTVFSDIFRGAFNPSAVLGGAVGIGISEAMKRGVGRGVFSNEAGLGSAPIAHAAAHTDSPVKQGLYGVFEVFADTIVICTLTALAILMSGVVIPYGTKVGAELSIGAFTTLYGSGAASIVVTIGITLFALSTILSWGLYGTRCAEFLFGEKCDKIYKTVFVLFIVVGATMNLGLAWDIADTLNGLMAIPNLIAVLALSGTVFKLTKEYFADRRNVAAQANARAKASGKISV